MKLWNLIWQVAVLVFLMSIAGGTSLERLGGAWAFIVIGEGFAVLMWFATRNGRKWNE